MSLWAGSEFRYRGFGTAEPDVRKEETLASVRYSPISSWPALRPTTHEGTVMR